MKQNARGLVLRVSPYGEGHRMITVLTAEWGLIHAVVYGASSLKSKNNTPTSLLSFSSFTFTVTGDRYRVDEAVAEELFFELRRDIERSALAQYFCELFACFAPEGEEAAELLRLLLNALSLLCGGEREPALIKAVTELTLMKLGGYMPELSACAGCGRTTGPFLLDCEEGVLLCPECDTGRQMLLPEGVLAAMRHILSAPFSRIFRFSLTPEALSSLARVTERYVLCRAERSFHTLSFYHSVRLPAEPPASHGG